MTSPASSRSDRTQSLPTRVEPLEPRQLLAASPFWVEGTDRGDSILVRQTSTSVRVTRNGSTVSRDADDVSAVVIYGRGGDDTVVADLTVKVPLTVYGGAGDDVIRGGPRADVLHGQSGDDRVYGGAGNDRVYGGGGDDHVEGGDGGDVLVTIGGDGDKDRVTGNGGHDNFWVDAGGTDDLADFSSADARHSVGSFMSYRIRSGNSYRTVRVPAELNGQSLADPVASERASGWRDFSANPLFASSGPDQDDVDQNGAADCYFLAALSSVAKIRPDVLSDRIVDLGDGTYAVHFERDGKSLFVRVDGDMPVFDKGLPYYAGLGAQNSLWVAVIEKAWAFFRHSEGTYQSIAFGKSSEAFRALGLGGVQSTDDPGDFRSEGGLLAGIDNRLKRGHLVIYSSLNRQPSGSKLFGNHILSVERVVRDKSGKAVALVLRDPYMVDGPKSTDGRNDGYITLTASQAAAWMEAVAWCDGVA